MSDCSKLKKNVEEIKIFMDEYGEAKIREILKRKNGKQELVLSFFTEWSYLLHKYDQNIKASDWDSIYKTLLLSVLFEGFIKIVCFSQNPKIILSKQKRERTLGNINKEFEKILFEREDNKIKRCEVEEILNLFSKLRNEFLHFPFYYRLDYRFPWLFFQLVSYTLEKLDLWNYLDDITQRIVKDHAKNKPSGISLLDEPLYRD